MINFQRWPAMILGLGMLCTGGLLRAQSSQAPATPPPDAPTPNLPAPSPSSTPPKDKNQQKPNPPSSAPDAPTPSPDAPASAPDAPPAAEPRHTTAQDNPFPSDISEKAAEAAKTPAKSPDAPLPSPGATGKPEPGSSSTDNTDRSGLDDPTRRQLKLESPDSTGSVYDPKRATDDLKVGKFYLQTGRYKGAYDRFKDATLFDHENVEAVFYLAEAARKLNLAKEAQDNYQLYLAADPDGSSAKAARKALNELGATSKN